MRHCQHPDRDATNLVCGFPLPCPFHTVVADVAKQTVTIPINPDASITLAAAAAGRLGEVVQALKPSRRRRAR